MGRADEDMSWFWKSVAAGDDAGDTETESDDDIDVDDRATTDGMESEHPPGEMHSALDLVEHLLEPEKYASAQQKVMNSACMRVSAFFKRRK